MRYRIVSDVGQDMGVYEGRNPEEALDAMARDAGYESQADAETRGIAPFRGTVERIYSEDLDTLTGLGKAGPGGIYKPDASPTTRLCAICRKPAMWIAGAGQAICVRHQDDY